MQNKELDNKIGVDGVKNVSEIKNQNQVMNGHRVMSMGSFYAMLGEKEFQLMTMKGTIDQLTAENTRLKNKLSELMKKES